MSTFRLKSHVEPNPLLFDLLDAKKRFIINYGGAGSGKSYAQGQNELVQIMYGGAGQRTLVIRKVAVTLRDSVIPLMTETLLDEFKLKSFFSFNKSERVLTFGLNGNEILFRGLDDPEKLKSITGITRIWIEEASELNEEDFDQINLRLRGKENLQIYLTFNPINELHWIKKRFFDNYNPKNTQIIKTTYKDNKFIDKAYIEELNDLKRLDYNYYRIYALGDWGRLDTGAEFFKHFKPERHCGKVELDKSQPIHLSLDENVNPYITLTLWQVDLKAKVIKQVHEILQKHPKNTVIDLAKEFNRWAASNEFRQIAYIYGDASSRKEDTKLEKGKNFFSILTDHIQLQTQMRVPQVNPSVSMSGSFINSILETNFGGWIILISDTCLDSISDYKYVKEDIDGSMKKEKVKDTKTGIMYEPYGHISDAFRYFITKLLSDEYRRFQTGYEKFPVILGKPKKALQRR